MGLVDRYKHGQCGYTHQGGVGYIKIQDSINSNPTFFQQLIQLFCLLHSSYSQHSMQTCATASFEQYSDGHHEQAYRLMDA